ncbi:hypothetical protein SAMN04515675_1934 [Pseudomonas costantinii]|uniref:Apea-like HEPN domain-containing protein n=3 Tax=Pseudomonas costantinii TaxID=168469 RepID=A0A1H5CHM5_9PSED|nr:hypothetical protein SAMN04515675_1934 [Pseudomonas costantinii]
MPSVLSEVVKPKPDDSYVWFESDWIKQEDAPLGYVQPMSSVPAYNPAWIVHLHPYTTVCRDAISGLNITIDQINQNSYDGQKLAEIVSILPLGTPSGIPALISFDGGVAIPQCADFPTKSRGVSKLNEILCSILLGGIHAKVLHPEAVVIGFLIDKVKLFDFTSSLHSQLRSNEASISDRITLFYPRALMAVDIQKAYLQGQQVISAVGNLSPFFLLNGYTAMVNQNNSDALNNLWIVVEQVTEYLWVHRYEKSKVNSSSVVVKRHAELKKQRSLDRVSSKHELLGLSGIINSPCLEALNKARLKRNLLVHAGEVPNLQVVIDLWMVLPDLLEKSSGVEPLGIRALNGVFDNDWAGPVNTNFDEWEEIAAKV